MRRYALVTLSLIAIASPPLHLGAVQGPAPDAPLPQYEATVKKTQANDGMMAMRMDPMGRTMSGVPLRQLIVQAYGLQQNQIIGGPDWLATDRWDIQLRADSPINPQQANLLMQDMFATRFKMVSRRETRELPVYELRLARADGTPGPDLKPSPVECGAQGRGRGGPPPAAAPATPAGREAGPGRGAGPLPPCRMMLTMGRIESWGQPLTSLTNYLSTQLGRPVIDRTGLTGGFDLTLSWTPDNFKPGMPMPQLPPGAPPMPQIDPNGPSLVTAVQEQLGLKLESTKGPVEVLVIESVQQPTEN